MIDVKEHIYNDDPALGHSDVRTYLKNVSYFFIGNGLIQAAIQFSPENDGSPNGLLIMDPDKLRPKRNSFSLDEISGIENTMLSLINDHTGEDLICKNIKAGWSYKYFVPVAEMYWESGPLKIIESFYCKNNKKPELIRKILIKNASEKSINITSMTAVPEHVFIKNNDYIKASDKLELYIQYNLDIQKESLSLKLVFNAEPDTEIVEYWKNIALCKSGSKLINKLFHMSSCLLPSVISKKGKVDASIWQYNREWVRDHSYMAIGLILSGSLFLAEVVLQRLLKEFISDNGSPMDSSEERDYDEVELDQNGLLLSTIKTYYLWSADLDFIRKNWQKIVLIADFPLKEVFYHKPSGMLFNSRDFWERHRAHGIEPEIEFIHQAMLVSGLKDAAFLAGLLSKKTEAEIVQNTLKEMEILWNQDWNIGGHARYNFSSEADSSGPWPLSSVIVARANMEAGNYEQVWRILKWLDEIPGSLSGSWFELYGDRISPPYAQIGITPWTWGETIMLVVQNIIGIFPEKEYIRIKPNLLPGMGNINFSVPIRNTRLHIKIKYVKEIKIPVFKCNSGIIKQIKNEVHVNYSKSDIIINGTVGATCN